MMQSVVDYSIVSLLRDDKLWDSDNYLHTTTKVTEYYSSLVQPVTDESEAVSVDKRLM